ALAAPPPGEALLQGGVVERAAAPQDRLKLTLLSGREPQLLLIGLAHSHARLTHAYFLPVSPVSPVWCSAYSRSAQTTSPLKDRSCCLASARLTANASNGKRIEMRRSAFCAFSMYPVYHRAGYTACDRANG